MKPPAARSVFGKPLVIPLWFALLFLPFKGLKAAVVLFLVIAAALPLLKLAGKALKGVRFPSGDVLSFIPHDRRLVALLVVPIVVLPLFAGNYLLDVAVLSGIYMILALGLNVVVGLTGLLNLGFVAFYAIGAYSFALLNTGLGLGFWNALPLSVGLTTVSGFLLAIPALRLKGDYLAIVTLGFGEIVRIVLNNWDSFTRGPNGISGIAPPSFFGTSLTRLSQYYFLVLAFVLLAVVVIVRVKDSKTGKAWLAIREDEIAAASVGINTTLYKLNSFAFGAFWAGIAGCLFSAKMRFVSPESFTFMESVLVLCMVIVGGSGSIGGVIVGAVVLVSLPEVLRDVQMYRMAAVGAGLVLLMIFRPQGLFGGGSVPARN